MVIEPSAGTRGATAAPSSSCQRTADWCSDVRGYENAATLGKRVHMSRELSWISLVCRDAAGSQLERCAYSLSDGRKELAKARKRKYRLV